MYDGALTLSGPRAGLQFSFGEPGFTPRDPATLHVPMPLLAGPTRDFFTTAAGPAETRDGFTVARSEGGLAGYYTGAPGAELEAMVATAYRELFALTAGLHLHRLWNFVPQINTVEHGLENYRRFCRARSLAFEARWGAGFEAQLPAASAVGTPQGGFTLAFVAGQSEPAHFENPQQVPAFRYPAQYGPRAPSFARATAVTAATGRQVFVSGTAAIRNHRSIGEGNLAQQISCTLENLQLIGATAQIGRSLGGGAAQRGFRIYLRDRRDFAAASKRLAADLLRPTDVVQYLEAAICRSELLIEIEAAIFDPK